MFLIARPARRQMPHRQPSPKVPTTHAAANNRCVTNKTILAGGISGRPAPSPCRDEHQQQTGRASTAPKSPNAAAPRAANLLGGSRLRQIGEAAHRRSAAGRWSIKRPRCRRHQSTTGCEHRFRAFTPRTGELSAVAKPPAPPRLLGHALSRRPAPAVRGPGPALRERPKALTCPVPCNRPSTVAGPDRSDGAPSPPTVEPAEMRVELHGSGCQARGRNRSIDVRCLRVAKRPMLALP